MLFYSLSNNGSNNTGYEENNKILIFCIFISPIYNFSLAGNIFVYTPSQGANKEKYFINHNIKVKMPTLAGNKQRRAFSTIRQKMEGPNPSEMDIKVFNPAPTYCLQVE